VKQSVWMCGSGGPMGWYEDTLHSITNRASAVSILEAPVIADVATFPPGDLDYPPQILHVGVGKVNALVVLFPKTDGTLVAAVGPIFTYYELAFEGTTRLSDNEWKQMLAWNNCSEYLPEWSGDLYAFSASIVPEFSNVIPFVAVMTLVIAAIVFRTKVVRRRIET
jgi:Protein of unknown function (DUF3160)